MSRALKVWGISYGYERRIVAARTQKEAAALPGDSLYAFRQYASVTGNETETALALSAPGVVFAKPHRGEVREWNAVTKQPHTTESIRSMSAPASTVQEAESE